MSDPREWRDARFKKALDNAPDLAARPSEAVRETILSKARATAAEAAKGTTSPQSKRRAWWSLGLPWNSALGTVAMVCLVCVLWWREDLPKQAQEAAAPAAPQVVPEAEVAAPTPSPVRENVQAGARRQERATEARSKSKAPRSAHEPATAVPKPAAPPEADVMAMPTPMPTPTPTPTPTPMVAVAPAPAPPAKAAGVGPAAAQILAAPPPPPPVAMPAPAAEPKPAAARRSSVSTLETVTVSGLRADVVAWTSLRVRTVSGPVLLPNDQLSASGQILLQQQLREVRRAADRAASSTALSAAAEPPGLVVEVLDGDRVVARLVLSEGELRQQVESALASKPR